MRSRISLTWVMDMLSGSMQSLIDSVMVSECEVTQKLAKGAD